MSRADRALHGSAAVRGGRPGRHAAGGLDPARARAAAVRARRRRRLAEDRGRQPDRQLQGPRHDLRGLRGRARGRRGRDLRLDRQYRGVACRLRGTRRDPWRCDRARGQDRDGQARPGADARRPGDRDPGQLRPCPAARAHLADQHPIALVNSVNEFRIEGQKTAAYEIAEALDDELDALCIPVGNAGNITAYWRGFREIGMRPKMFGFQAAGAAPLVLGKPVEFPETVASAISIGNPARWEQAMDAMTSSGGAVNSVTDEQILDAYRFLAREEGVFCEPASAGIGRRADRARRRRRRTHRLRAHRPRAQG